MKTLCLISMFGLAVLLGGCVTHDSVAQSGTVVTESLTPTGNAELDKLIASLEQQGDTNTISAVMSGVLAVYASRDAADVSLTVAALESLRSGNTNDAFRILEARLDGVLIPLGNPKWEHQYHTVIEKAKDYRSKYPHTSGDSARDAAVSNVLHSVSQ